MKNPTQRQKRSLGMRARTSAAALCIAVTLAEVLLATGPLHAQTYQYRLLYSFTGGSDGSQPMARLVVDARGNVYGTTPVGGVASGTVFKVDPSRKETVLDDLGGSPRAGLVVDALGNLYGTTSFGGSGWGTVFKVDAGGGNEAILYSFCSVVVGGICTDGKDPEASLVLDGSGNLYGTTSSGGASNHGTVFKVDMSGNETVLHSFAGSPDGDGPGTGVTLDAQGNLYGATGGGGTFGLGTVFKVNTSGNETVLHSFTGSKKDGALPQGPLALDAEGNLYGATFFDAHWGNGTVFKVDAGGNVTVLYRFTGGPSKYPTGGLVLDEHGNLYGTTSGGGHACQGLSAQAECGSRYYGTVFKLDPSGKQTVLYTFTGGTDGGTPMTGVALDKHGNLYGTTPIGGLASDCGTVFKLTR